MLALGNENDELMGDFVDNEENLVSTLRTS